MTITTIIILNLALSLLAMLGVYAVAALAQRLPVTAPGDDAESGRGGDPWVPSGPLPLPQLRAHEAVRELARAAY
jgi:hypothetical protein